MKFTLVIDTERQEEVIVYCHAENELTEKLQRLLNSDDFSVLGQNGDEYKRLELSKIYCFTVEDNKIYAHLENDKYRIKERLYKIEESLPDFYVKINQSCIINIKKIDSFYSNFSASLTVRLKNGYTDYVSRRNLKNVKERLGV